MPVRIVHPVDAGVVINPVDQWDCPRDAFLFRIDGLRGVEGGAGLLVRSGIVIEAAPALKGFIRRTWLTDVVPSLLKMNCRATLLKENPQHA